MARPPLPHLLLAAALAQALPCHAQTVELSSIEQRWVDAGAFVVAFARRQGLPLDIVVQPQDAPGLAPLAMGFADGRCKLVLSMRGNPEAEETLEGMPAELAPLLIEAMTAHEVGHCWRYVQGAWQTLPAGFVDAPVDGHADTPPEFARRIGDMRATRREEGFADLVGLAWVLAHHPAQYLRVQTWLARLRADQPVPGSHHDTRAWVDMAVDASLFTPGKGVFEQAWQVWQRGLKAGPAGAAERLPTVSAR